MKLIPLTQGKFAKVDDEDYEYLNQWKWCYRSGRCGYAVRVVRHNGVQSNIWMHRAIINPPQEMQVDHINADRLDNRKENLRVCTNAQNQHNASRRSTNKSGYKGVCWVIAKQKWIAQIEMNGHGRTIGRFDNPIDAAKAYDKVARELFGEFAKTNFPL